MNSFQTMQALLKSSYNIGVSAEWLTACLEWIQQENQGQSLSTDDLLSLVYEQWLLSDLSEIGESVLPSDMTYADKMELTSNYPLQLISVIDVGFPLYGQMQKLQGRENPNEEVSADKPFQPAWEPKQSRMLLLELTDGHIQVKAMEYRPIQNLSGQLPSGSKMLLIGPLICMRGMILLTPGSIQVLGGEVDGLVEQNRPLNNLEKVMLKNREDEGKHAKAEFSGKSIKQTPGKLDDHLKASVKKEDIYLNEHTLDHKTSQCQIKTEPKHVVSQGRINMNIQGTQSHYLSRLPDHIKDEMKLEINNCTYQASYSSVSNAVISTSGRSKEEIHSALTRTVATESSKSNIDTQWDSEMDYSEIFDDDMDFEGTDIFDGASKVLNEPYKPSKCPTGSNINNTKLKLKFGFSGPQENQAPIPGGSDNDARSLLNKSPDSHLKTFCVQSFNNSKSSGPDQDDLFGDDCEIIEANYSASSHINKNIIKAPDDNYPFLSRKYQKTLNTTDYQKGICLSAAHTSSNQCSPTIPYLNEGALNFPLESETAKSPSIFLKKAPLFKAKSTSSSGTSKTVTSKQPKIQSKLSDMFGTKSHMSKKGTITSSSNSIVIDDDTLPSSATIKIERLKEPFTTKNPFIDNSCVSRYSEKKLPGVVSEQSISINQERLLPCGESDSLIHSKNKTHSEISSNPFACAKENTLLKAIIHPFGDFSDIKVNLSEDMPYKYLVDVMKLTPPASITVKAYISTLIDKLGSDGGAQWTLACRINDGTASVDVELSNCVLTKLIGFTAKDSLVMRQKIKEDPQVKSALMKGLSQCQQKLINISCLMDLEILSLSRRPTVTKLTQLSKEHVIQLIKRLQPVTAC